MASVTNSQRVVVLGATGRVGTLLRKVWKDRSPIPQHMVHQSRQVCDAGAEETPMVYWGGGAIPQEFADAKAIIAAWGVVPGSNTDFSENIKLAVQAMELAQQIGAKMVLHFSSIAVYAPQSEPMAESNPLAPRTPYGVAKRDMEVAIASWKARNPQGPDYCCLRIGSIAGAESLFASIGKFRNGGTPQVVLDRFPDGVGPRRSYIAPGDFADVLSKLLRLDPSALPTELNVGAPCPVGMADLLRAAHVPFSWRPAPEDAWQDAVMDCSALAKLADLDDSIADPKHIISDWSRWSSNS